MENTDKELVMTTSGLQANECAGISLWVIGGALSDKKSHHNNNLLN